LRKHRAQRLQATATLRLPAWAKPEGQVGVGALICSLI
jgi:hypothetical protein